MKLPVAQLPEGQSSFQWSSEKELDLKAFREQRIQQGYALTSPLLLDLDVTRLEPDYYLRGKMQFSLDQNCAHCGESVTSNIKAPFELALLRTDKVKAGTERLSEEADDLDLICFTGPELKLDSILEEQFVLNVPIQAECGTAACLERARVLMEKMHEQADHWKDTNSPFSVLKDLKNKK